MEEESIMLDEHNQKSNDKKNKADISIKMMMIVMAMMAVTIVGLMATLAFLLVNGEAAAQLKDLKQPAASQLKSDLSSSSLSFSWITPMSMKVWNEDGDEDVIHLRPAGKIGGIRVQCLFDGYLEDDEEATVAIYGCQDWTKIEIVILSKYSHGSMFNFLPLNGTTHEEMDSYEEEENSQVFIEEDKNELLKRFKRSNFGFPEDEDYLDIDFAGQNMIYPKSVSHQFSASFDKALFNKLDQNETKCREYVAKIIGLAQPYFRHNSLGIKIFFDVIGEIKYIENKEFKINPYDDGLHIQDATKIESKHPLTIFTFTDDNTMWRGVAPKRKACDPTNGRAITKWRSDDLKCARTFAHEHGHWFALWHDADEDIRKSLPVSEPCTGKGLMTDSENKPEEWSECSRLRIQKWFHRGGKECLKEVSACVNEDWKVPCICGKNQKENLCSSQYQVCDDSTGICHVNARAEAELMRLNDLEEKCLSFSASSGQALESGCSQPQDLTDGMFVCVRDGKTCHATCNPGFKLETSDRFMECINDQWTPPAATFNCIPDSEYAAPTILVESVGRAAEYWGGRMGYFDRTQQKLNGRPVYQQRGGGHFLYHNMKRGTWQVGSTRGGWSAVLKVTSDDSAPVSTGWLYYDGKWRTDDSTLMVSSSPADPSSSCTTIQVAATGPAASAQSEKMGEYRWEGEWLNGHKLFTGGSGKDNYLRIRTGKSTWSIGPEKDSGGAGIESGRGTTCPCNPQAGPTIRLGWDGWTYWDGGNWQVDETIQVTCV